MRFPFTRNCPLAVFVIQPPACELRDTNVYEP